MTFEKSPPKVDDYSSYETKPDRDKSLMTTSASFAWHNLPQLYARVQEEHQLRAAYQRLTTRRPSAAAGELVLITGPSGCGKTALVHKTMPPILEAAGGYFLHGKFEQTAQDNYAPFFTCLEQFCRLVQNERTATERERMRSKVIASIAAEKVLLDMIPALADFVAGQDSSSPNDLRLLQEVDTKGPGIQTQFIFAFCSLLRSVCSLERPFTIFLDDWQWSDPPTIDLLAALVQDTTIQGLMIVCSCRGNEVSYNHYLSVMLRELEATGTQITELQLSNLDQYQICEMMASVLQRTPTEERLQRLSRIVKLRTDGNFFHILQFLSFLTEEEILDWDKTADEFEAIIDSRVRANSPVSLLTQRIQRLPQNVQNVLKIAAFIGNRFDTRVLHYTLDDTTVENLEESLLVAQAKGLVLYDPSAVSWRFVHDQIQHSAYAMIAEKEREQFHLELGTKLWESLEGELLDRYTPLVVNQLRFGARLIPSQEEKDRLVAFILQAGQKAMAASNFFMASHNLHLGVELLDSRSCWRDQYELCLSLFYTVAEVEFCIGNFDRMNAMIDVLLHHVRHQDDRARALTLRVSALGAQGDLVRAVELGMKTLSDLGENFPRNPGLLRVIMAFGQLNQTLHRLSDDDILNLPVMTDPSRSVAMILMMIIFPFALYVHQKLAPFLIFRIIQRTLSDGISAVSSSGFGTFAMIVSSGFGQIEMGTRYGHVALKLLEQSGTKEWLPRVYSAVYGFVFSWKGELDDQMKPLLTAYRVGLASGDIEFAIMSACFHVSMATHISCPLEEIMSAGEGYMQLIKNHKQTNMINFLYPTLHFVANMLAGNETKASVLHRQWYLCADEVLQNALEDKNATSAGTFFYH